MRPDYIITADADPSHETNIKLSAIAITFGFSVGYELSTKESELIYEAMEKHYLNGLLLEDYTPSEGVGIFRGPDWPGQFDLDPFNVLVLDAKKMEWPKPWPNHHILRLERKPWQRERHKDFSGDIRDYHTARLAWVMMPNTRITPDNSRGFRYKEDS